jgi:tRNA pseudouridine32 synthase / 23S rRNA pseudouridine746 synthase
MGISRRPSVVTMPITLQPYPSILSFLSARFPAITREVWEKRIEDGKVLDDNGLPITMNSEYSPQKRIVYFREVNQEATIPFREKILYQDDRILVACKPHFLPVTPGGRYVEECLLNRLRNATGIVDLAPLHRIDRETAGIVLFSTDRKTCGRYGELFLSGKLEKSYQAISVFTPPDNGNTWLIEDRIGRGDPWFRMKVVAGAINARSRIIFLGTKAGKSLFDLHPITGKTHQLRIHMSSIGCGILNDRYYPTLQPESADNFDTPLQLIAKTVKFRDPFSGKLHEFISERELI